METKQSANVAMPVKQHTEYHLAAKMVKEREQEQNSREQSHAGRTTSTPIFFVVVSIGWLADEFVGDKTWQWTET